MRRKSETDCHSACTTTRARHIDADYQSGTFENRLPDDRLELQKLAASHHLATHALQG
jgi:hypothetical protein